MSEAPVVVATPPCMFCHEASSVEVSMESYIRWAGGEHIQNVFPELNPGERELLITGTHNECWDKMFCCCETLGKPECEVHSP